MGMDIGYELILPIKEHAEIILPWINDEQTLKQSYHQSSRGSDLFFEEFLSRYFTSIKFPSLFILEKGERSGYLRFKEVVYKSKKAVEISICISPSKRGRGVAKNALTHILEWLKNKGAALLIAEIKKDNASSFKVFTAVGFHISESTRKQIVDKEPIDIVVLTKKLEQRSQKEVFIIAEAGSNWRMGTKKRDMTMAKSLIDVAKECGADAVKFQTYRPETIYVNNAGKANYLADAGILEEITTIFEDLSMPYEMIKELSQYAKLNSIEFMSTSFSENDFKEVDPYVQFHKIASYENGHVHLLKLAAASKKPVFLSTGATTVEEIEWALSYFFQAGGKDITLLQCTAKYPASDDSMNLNALTFLKERFHLPVGLSDHSLDPIVAPVMATALGADVIEKHFTLSNYLPGPDHSFAVTPTGLKAMVKAIREAEKMRGIGIKTVLPEEEELRLFCKRGLQATRSVEIGDIFKEGSNFAILRPGTQVQGVHPRYLTEVEGNKAKRKINPGSGIMFGDW